MRRLSTVNMRLACHNNCTSCLILCANRNKSHPLLNDTASDVGLYRIPAPAWILPFVHIRLKSGSGQNLAGFSDFSRIFKMLRWPTDLLSALSCLCQHKHFFSLRTNTAQNSLKFGRRNHYDHSTDEMIRFWTKLYHIQGSRIRQKIRINVKPVLPRSEWLYKFHSTWHTAYAGLASPLHTCNGKGLYTVLDLPGVCKGSTPHCLRTTLSLMSENIGRGIDCGNIGLYAYTCFLSNKVHQKFRVAGNSSQTQLWS